MDAQLLEIFNEVIKDRTIETIENHTKLADDLGLDSIALAELTVRIEDKFSVDVFEDGIVLTVGEIKEKLAGK